MPRRDFALEDHGSIAVLQPLTARARRWIEACAVEGLPWIGGGLALEPRMAGALVDGARRAGLNVSAPRAVSLVALAERGLV